jgi:thymidylate kinase
MIIVEGPDNAGKTTLVNHIISEFGSKVELSHHSRLKGAERDKLARQTPMEQRAFVYGNLNRAVLSKGPVDVHDRLFYSELVYGPIFHPPVVFNYEETRHINRLLTAISPPIIFCLPPLEVVSGYAEGEHQLTGVAENTKKIYDSYMVLSALARPRITTYDYTRGPASLARITAVVARYLERREKRTW